MTGLGGLLKGIQEGYRNRFRPAKAVQCKWPSGNGPRFVLLTNGGSQAQLLVELLEDERCSFKIVLVRPALPKNHQGQNFVRRWYVTILARIKGNSIVRALVRKRPQRFCRQHIRGGFLNSKRLIRILADLSPDYILLMNVGIINGQVIKTARKAVLNAHPGLLPWVRGVDAVASSLLEGIAAGTSVHFVNEGIDTGPILSRYLLPIESDDSLEVLKERANLLAVFALTEAVRTILKGERLERHAQSERFNLHRRLDVDELTRVRVLIAGGRGPELYRRWKSDHPELLDGVCLMKKYEEIFEVERKDARSARSRRDAQGSGISERVMEIRPS